MEDIDDIAPMVYYDITTLPPEQRGRGDFGPYLRADANVIRRMLDALMINPPSDFNYDNVIKIPDHTRRVSGFGGEYMAQARANLSRVQAVCKASRSKFLDACSDVDHMCRMVNDAVQRIFEHTTVLIMAQSTSITRGR